MATRTGGLVAPRIPLIISAVPDDSHNKDVLKPGDFITQLNGTTIEFADQLKPELDNLKNQTITAVVRRDNQEMEVPVKINEEGKMGMAFRSEEHTSELQSRPHLVCRLLLEKKKKQKKAQQ